MLDSSSRRSAPSSSSLLPRSRSDASSRSARSTAQQQHSFHLRRAQADAHPRSKVAAQQEASFQLAASPTRSSSGASFWVPPSRAASPGGAGTSSGTHPTSSLLSTAAARSPRPTVGVRPCAQRPAAQRAWLARYRLSDSKLQDLPFIVWEALLLRYAVNSSSKPDLEFVPWPCLLHTHRKLTPRLGSFTVFSGAWASFALELFEDARWMCASAGNCSSSRLRGMAVLSIESPSYLLSWSPPALKPTVVSSHLPAFPGSGNGRFQLPYPTSAHFDGTALPRVPTLARRKVLAALVANTLLEHKIHGNRSSSRSSSGSGGSIGRGPLRSLLHTECHNAPADCQALGGHRGGSKIWNLNNQTFSAYAGAVFCLQPWGDSATRKGFWDAIMAGCINVIFDNVGYNETDRWFGDHRQWTVRVPLSHVVAPGSGVLGYLRSISRPKVEQLHEAVMAIRGRVQYAIDEGTPGGDGVDVIVAQVAEHFRGLRTSGDLPRKHSGENTCSTIIGHICRQVRWMGRPPTPSRTL